MFYFTWWWNVQIKQPEINFSMRPFLAHTFDRKSMGLKKPTFFIARPYTNFFKYQENSS